MNGILLSGLPEQRYMWGSFFLLLYLSLLCASDSVFGIYAARVVERSEAAVLPRCGYRRWVHRAMLRSSTFLLPMMAVLTVTECLLHTDAWIQVLCSAGLMTLNLIVLGNLLLFFTLLYRNVRLGFLVCILTQLSSMLYSEALPPVGKLLLPGNWGMALRTTLADPNGIAVWPSITIEIVILTALWTFGWRVIRKYRKGV